jgi:Ca2+-binding EF-hand superfamily protein
MGFLRKGKVPLSVTSSVGKWRPFARMRAADPREIDDMTEYMEMVSMPTLFETMIQEITTKQPADPLQFLIDYINENPIKMRKRVPADFRETIKRLFMGADADGSGFLDRKELKTVFDGLKEELGLSSKDIKLIMAEADENDDGVIEYEEFALVAAQVLEAIYAKMNYEYDQAMRKEEAEDAAADLLRGLTENDLLDILKGVFQNADADGNGSLDRKEFANCLKDANLGFTKKEINVLMSEVDVDGDGIVTYEEFAPLAFQILVEVASADFFDVPNEQGNMEEFLSGILTTDLDSHGRITHSAAEAALLGADLGITRIQALSCLSECKEWDKHNRVEATALLCPAAGVLLSLFRSWGMI